MGYGILRGQKCKLGDIKGMEIHISRSRSSRSNPDIDTDKSKDNYAIIEVDKLNKKVTGRIAELPGQRTKTGKMRKIYNNAVYMYDFIATGTHEDIMSMSAEQRKKYFEDVVDFFKDKFGEKNIMYAKVHNDERTPHLHLGLVPEYKGKLAAYQLFTRESMRKLQDEFFAEVSSRYGLERGELVDDNEDKPKRKHKTAVELRSETLAEVNREKENLARLRSDVADAERQRLETLKLLEDLQAETEKKKKELEDNKLLADNEEKRFLQVYEEQSAFLLDVKKAKKLINLAEIKETEYKITNFLLNESEKELKENNENLKSIREEKNKIIAEIDDKLIKPIIDVALAYEKDKPNLFLKSFKNFAKQALNILPKLQQFKDAKNNDRKIILDKLGISADLKNYDEVEKAYKEMWRDM